MAHVALARATACSRCAAFARTLPMNAAIAADPSTANQPWRPAIRGCEEAGSPPSFAPQRRTIPLRIRDTHEAALADTAAAGVQLGASVVRLEDAAVAASVTCTVAAVDDDGSS